MDVREQLCRGWSLSDGLVRNGEVVGTCFLVGFTVMADVYRDRAFANQQFRICSQECIYCTLDFTRLSQEVRRGRGVYYFLSNTQTVGSWGVAPFSDESLSYLLLYIFCSLVKVISMGPVPPSPTSPPGAHR